MRFMCVDQSSVTVYVIAADTLPVNLLIFLTAGWVLCGDS